MSIWLTAKECAGLPGFPTMEHNIRNRLDKQSGGNSALRRRREGSKAFEYHMDCLPEVAKQIVQERFLNTLLTKPNNGFKHSLKTNKSAVRVTQELDLMRKCPAILEKRSPCLTTISVLLLMPGWLWSLRFYGWRMRQE